jgi:signal transduction histidine kinase
VLGLVVLPYYWQTWWLRLSALASALGLLGGLIRAHEKRKSRQRMEALRHQNVLQRERTRIARDVHDEVGAKLTKICYLSELAKHDLPRLAEAEQGIDRIGHRARSHRFAR